MPDVLINCSLSNAQATVFVHADDYRIYQESDGVPNCVGLWHPSGGEAKKQWVRDHPSLAEYLLKKSAADLIEQEPDGAVSEFELTAEETNTDSAVVSSHGEVGGPEAGNAPAAEEPEPNDPVTETEPEPEDTVAGDGSEDTTDGSDGDDVAVGDNPEPADAVDGYENLTSLGLPESCIDELVGAGLFTKEAILAHEDLSKIKGIGVKTRDKILTILKGE